MLTGIAAFSWPAGRSPAAPPPLQGWAHSRPRAATAAQLGLGHASCLCLKWYKAREGMCRGHLLVDVPTASICYRLGRLPHVSCPFPGCRPLRGGVVHVP